MDSMFDDTPSALPKPSHQRHMPMDRVDRMGTACACARLAIDAAACVTGRELVVDGGITGKFT